jgi:hypothetical protein
LLVAASRSADPPPHVLSSPPAGGTYNYGGHDVTAVAEQEEAPAEEMEGEGEEGISEEDQMAAAMKHIRWGASTCPLVLLNSPTCNLLATAG